MDSKVPSYASFVSFRVFRIWSMRSLLCLMDSKDLHGMESKIGILRGIRTKAGVDGFEAWLPLMDSNEGMSLMDSKQ